MFKAVSEFFNGHKIPTDFELELEKKTLALTQYSEELKMQRDAVVKKMNNEWKRSTLLQGGHFNRNNVLKPTGR